MNGEKSIRNKFQHWPTLVWVITVVVCAVLFRVIKGNRPDLIEAIYIGCCISIYAAIGIWLAVGSSWWRYIVQFIGFIAVTIMILTTGPANTEMFLLMFFFGVLIVGTVATPIVIFRIFRNGSLAKPSPDDVTVTEALQFGVIHLMGLTTGVAILMALGQWLYPLMISINDGDVFFVILKLGVTLALGTLIAAWATLGIRPLLRFFVSGTAIVILASFNYFFIKDASPVQWIYAVLTLIVWAQITILFWCLRLEGYRFIRRPRIS